MFNWLLKCKQEQAQPLRATLLTHGIRNDIMDSVREQFDRAFISKATNNAYKNEQELKDALRRETEKVLKGLWMRAYDHYRERLDSLPENFISRTDFKAISSSGDEISMSLEGYPGVGEGYDIVVEDAEWAGLWKEVNHLRSVIDSFCREEEDLIETAAVLVRSCETVEQLLKAWPGVEPYLPEIQENHVGKGYLASIDVGALDAKLKMGGE